MELVLQIIIVIALIIGTLFSFLGVAGFIRFPDVYTRLHATGKVGVYGVVFLLIAAILWTPLSFGKGLVIMLAILLSGPVAAHALASAAYRIGIPMLGHSRDELQDTPEAEEGARSPVRKDPR
jgi:multicomponent Na+:H+ antiporter subunit G